MRPVWLDTAQGLEMSKYGTKESELRDRGVAAGLQSGRFVYQMRGARLKCTYCGRTGWSNGSWLDNCLKGHRHVCACGRVFASKQGLSTHRRHRHDKEGK